MAELRLRNVDSWRHRTLILDGLTFRAPSGRITALLGEDQTAPRKALKVIAGIDKAHDGTISIDGEDVTKRRARDRSVATVFRSSALMPHKSAYDNIAYPLRLASLGREEIDERVKAAAGHFGLTEQLPLRPKKLTELQRYQIGIARALVRDPALYLFERPSDEYAVFLNVATAEMKRLRDDYDRTVVYATDIVDEARELANWIVIIHNGRKLQQGSPRRILERPATRYVARMFGATLKTVRVTGVDRSTIKARLKDGTEVAVPADPTKEAFEGDRGTLGIWPEHIRHEGDKPIYPPEHCHLFDEEGRAVAGPGRREAES